MATPLWHKGFPEFSGSTKSLVEVLASGALSEAKYLAWASEEYQIPILSSDFFNLAKNFNLLLDHSAPAWSDSFFPVNEWKGMLYIACLEPQPVQLKKKHVFVLGSYKDMKALWEKMEKPLEASVMLDISELQAPEKTTNNNEAPHAKSTPLVIELPPPTPVAVAAPAPVAKEKTDESAFANLQFDSIPLTVDNTPPVPTTLIKKDSPQPPPRVRAKDSAFAPLTSTNTPSAAPFTPKTAPIKIAETPSPAAPTPPAVEATGVKMRPNFTVTNYEIPKEFRNEKTKTSATSPSIEPEREITNVAKVPTSNEMSFTTTKTIMPFPERTSQFTFTRTIYSSQVILEAESKIQDNLDPQKALLSAFKILQDYYKKLMWVVRDQKGYAFPIACNSDWEFTEEAWNEPVAFKHVNPFRTAKMTQKPYHGEVFSSPATDKFFKMWNNGKKPEFFSVVPIMMYGKVFGYLVGCEKGPHFNKTTSLEVMEITGRELLETFIKIHNIMAKNNAA